MCTIDGRMFAACVCLNVGARVCVCVCLYALMCYSIKMYIENVNNRHRQKKLMVKSATNMKYTLREYIIDQLGRGAIQWWMWYLLDPYIHLRIYILYTEKNRFVLSRGHSALQKDNNCHPLSIWIMFNLFPYTNKCFKIRISWHQVLCPLRRYIIFFSFLA